MYCASPCGCLDQTSQRGLLYRGVVLSEKAIGVIKGDATSLDNGSYKCHKLVPQILSSLDSSKIAPILFHLSPPPTVNPPTHLIANIPSIL